MQDIRKTTLAELVTQRAAAAVVFEKHRLDFCCKGKRPLEDACSSQGLDTDQIVAELETVFKQNDQSQESKFDEMPLDQLADYIAFKHHSYVRQMIPIITAHTAKVADRHGENNPNLVKIAACWQELANDLTHHMFKEEGVLFPYVKRIVQAERMGIEADFPKRAFVSSPIEVMEMEHDRAGELLAEIRNLSNDFTPPLIACTTYRLSFKELEEFESDLHRHVHLENNVFFPKAQRLEREMIGRLEGQLIS